ncbi:MAG: hypothetical protein Q7V88_07990 [Actinomycetota bacterium]|nr:hypothetical protein [Actinomycetota bacterium]
MSLDPPKVLLEQSFLRSIADPTDSHHERAVHLYLDLVQQYEQEQVLLVAVGDHLRPHRGWQRSGPLAPVEALPVGFQHRRWAHRTEAQGDPALALTLVMCQRHKVRRVASFDPRLQQYDLVLLPDAAPWSADQPPAGELAGELAGDLAGAPADDTGSPADNE